MYCKFKIMFQDRRRNYLVSEPNYHTTKFFTAYLLTMEMNKTGKLMKKILDLGIPILELNKILMYEFWCNYLKPGYGVKSKFSYMDRYSFIIYLRYRRF